MFAGIMNEQNLWGLEEKLFQKVDQEKEKGILGRQRGKFFLCSILGWFTVVSRMLFLEFLSLRLIRIHVAEFLASCTDISWPGFRCPSP